MRSAAVLALQWPGARVIQALPPHGAPCRRRRCVLAPDNRTLDCKPHRLAARRRAARVQTREVVWDLIPPPKQTLRIVLRSSRSRTATAPRPASQCQGWGGSAHSRFRAQAVPSSHLAAALRSVQSARAPHRTAFPSRAVQQTRLLAWSTLALPCRPHLADRVGPRSFARRFTFSTKNAEGKVWPPLRQIEWRYAHPVISLNVTTPPNTRATLVTCRDTMFCCAGAGGGRSASYAVCVGVLVPMPFFLCARACAGA